MAKRYHVYTRDINGRWTYQTDTTSPKDVSPIAEAAWPLGIKYEVIDDETEPQTTKRPTLR